jgi:peroxiredoxin
MSPYACLFAGLMLGAAPTAPGDAAPVPKLEKSQELTWRGHFTEAILRPNVRAFRAYDVETRLFVWDVSPKGADVALFTSVKFKPDIKTTPEPPAVVRLELARVEPDGRLRLLSAAALTQPAEKRHAAPPPPLTLEGLPTFEPSFFLAFPGERVRPGQAWEVPDEKRPPLTYKVERPDSALGVRCWRVAGTQQSDDWEKPHLERPAWKRSETVWVSAGHGCALRLERTVEKRDPQTGELGFRAKLTYEQSGRMSYLGRLGEDRREEVAAAAEFAAELDGLLADPARAAAPGFEALLKRIELHVSTHVSGEAVPYREAILSVRRKAEAAKRGHVPPAPPAPETGEAPALIVGRPAPDLTAKDLVSGDAVRLSRLRGRPAVLLYYQPGSARTAGPVLQFAQELFENVGDRAYVVPLAIGHSDAALKQREDLKLTVHVLAGRDVYRLHGIESAPCLVVIDAKGEVRKVAQGWSDENAAAVRAELEKWVK